MKWGRLGDLMASRHVLFWSRKTEETEAADPGPGILFVAREEYHSLFWQTTGFLSKDNIDLDLGVHCILVVALAVYHPC
jgi:hypothetical protein